MRRQTDGEIEKREYGGRRHSECRGKTHQTEAGLISNRLDADGFDGPVGPGTHGLWNQAWLKSRAGPASTASTIKVSTIRISRRNAR